MNTYFTALTCSTMNTRLMYFLAFIICLTFGFFIGKKMQEKQDEKK